MRMKDKVAIVTGGGSGFGAGIVRKFAAEGARVLVADLNLDAARDIAGSIGAAAQALRVARALKCGQVYVNNYGAGGGIELPFGGVKSSGHGREKGFEALYGFSTLKTIAIQHG